MNSNYSFYRRKGESYFSIIETIIAQLNCAPEIHPSNYSCLPSVLEVKFSLSYKFLFMFTNRIQLLKTFHSTAHKFSYSSVYGLMSFPGNLEVITSIWRCETTLLTPPLGLKLQLAHPN